MAKTYRPRFAWGNKTPTGFAYALDLDDALHTTITTGQPMILCDRRFGTYHRPNPYLSEHTPRYLGQLQAVPLPIRLDLRQTILDLDDTRYSRYRVIQAKHAE